MPLLVFGMNAISAYILSELLSSVLSNIHVAPGVDVTQWAYRSILHVIPDAAFADTPPPGFSRPGDNRLRPPSAGR